MSQFLVDATSLEALGTELGSLHTRLDAMPSVVYGFEGLLGGDNMDQAVESFCTSWHHAVAEVAGEIHDLMGGLQRAQHAYQAIDDKVRQAAAAGGSAPAGLPIGGRPSACAPHPTGGAGLTGGSPAGPTRPTAGPTTRPTAGPTPVRTVSAPTHAGPAPITVSDPHLTQSQGMFAAKLATLTGLSPRVAAAWVSSEQGGADGSDNFLNISGLGGAQGPAQGPVHDPDLAAAQTAAYLRQSDSPGIRAILATGGRSPEQQLKAITDSGFSHDGYGGGATLRDHYRALSGLTVAVA